MLVGRERYPLWDVNTQRTADPVLVSQRYLVEKTTRTSEVITVHRDTLESDFSQETLVCQHSNIRPLWMEKMLLLWITATAACNNSSNSSNSNVSRRRSLSSDSTISLKERIKQSSGWSPSRQRRKERNGSISVWYFYWKIPLSIIVQIIYFSCIENKDWFSNDIKLSFFANVLITGV